MTETKFMTFGNAISALKDGRRVARAGWNGKGMYLFLEHDSADHNAEGHYSICGISSELFNPGDVGTVTRLPHINMRAAGGETVVGWLASQTDMLAEDWQFVP